MSQLERYYQLIQRPIITEKASDDTITRNAYHFRVPVHANKSEIRRAIETLFEVKVASVNTLRKKGKRRRRGFNIGFTQQWKKAMVTLGEGETIDLI